MRLVFAGTPAAAVPSLDALLKSRHEVAAVITRPDAPAGRGRRVGPSPVAERAAEVGLELLKPATPRDKGFLQRMRALAPDCCPVTAYGALIPQAALEIPRHGWANLHFSLLPAWRGTAPATCSPGSPNPAPACWSLLSTASRRGSCGHGRSWPTGSVMRPS